MTSEVQYKLRSSNWVLEYLKEPHTLGERRGTYLPLDGFVYFSEELCSSHADRAWFITAEEAGKLVGVIKMTRATMKNQHVFVWIDVHEKCRRQGVATAMIEKLNTLLPHQCPVALTGTDGLGVEAKMDECITRLLTNAKIVGLGDTKERREVSPVPQPFDL